MNKRLVPYLYLIPMLLGLVYIGLMFGMINYIIVACVAFASFLFGVITTDDKEKRYEYKHNV